MYSRTETFLSQRSQGVSLGKDWSAKAAVLSGVQQGSVLASFTIFINDLLECVQSCCKAIANDTNLYMHEDTGRHL